MLDCVMNSVIHLFWCITLIVLVLVMFALLLVQGITSHAASYAEDDKMHLFKEEMKGIEGTFDSVPNAMLTLFQATTGGVDWAEPYSLFGNAGAGYELFFLFYIAFFAIVAWNIVMSTFVEKAFKLAVPDFDEMQLQKRRADAKIAKDLTTLLTDTLDDDHNGLISLEAFKAHHADDRLRKFFSSRGIDMKDAELFFEMLRSVKGRNEVDIHTFVLGCLRLRGMASAIDVQALHFDIRGMHAEHNTQLRKMDSVIDLLIKGQNQRDRILESLSAPPQGQQVDHQRCDIGTFVDKIIAHPGVRIVRRDRHLEAGAGAAV